MENITKFFGGVFAEFAKADFAFLVIVEGCAFLLIFIISLIACALSQRARAADKKPFLYAVNLFTAITLAVFLSEFGLEQSVAAACIFWGVGFAMYGALCLFKPKEKYQPVPENVAYVQPLSASPRPKNQPEMMRVAPAVQSGVRLDHALSIADKMLVKNIGRGDRQELERIKTALTVLKVKGTLTPQEGEGLNEMFNSLLKLMAKYDL